jgi:hypothetical protein
VNTYKQHYLNSIRANSAYPTYRGFIGTIALLGYLLGAAFGCGAIAGGLTAMSQSYLLGLVVFVAGGIFAVIIIFLASLFKEAALIVADIGDATVDANSRVGVAP